MRPSSQTMAMLPLATLFVLLLRSDEAIAAPGDGGRLNTYEKPRLLLYTGNAIAHVDTWQKAKDFCWSKPDDPNYYQRTKHIYSYLADSNEWCDWMARRHLVGEDEIGDHIHDGLKQTSEWVPIRDYYNKNNWVQIGKWNGKDIDGTCKTYRDIYGIPNPRELVNQEEGVDESVHCKKPFGCKGDYCVYKCPHKRGYYPDKTDCRAYCRCSGNDEPSFWQRVEGDGLIWNPYCGTSDPLNQKDKPLGGMTGGCAQGDHYKEEIDMSYCSGEKRRSLTEPHSLRGRALQDGVPSQYNYGPDWGELPGKAAGELNYVLCSNIPIPPEFPITCGAVWGDPHLVTFDNLRYHFQGTGGYVLSKSLDSGFELQAEMDKFDPDIQATVVRKVILQTGRPGEPKIEIGYKPLNPYAYPSIWSCKMYFYLDDVEMPLDAKWGKNGTLATDTEAAAFFAVKHDRTFWFKGSKISFKVRKKHSKKMGCYLNLHVCLPDEIKAERIVGLLGSPNGDTSDDFMDASGNNLNLAAPGFSDAYDYAIQNWCVRDQADSLAKEPMPTDGCNEPYSESLEELVAQAPDEIKEICGVDINCLIEGSAGDIEDAVDSTRELDENFGGLETNPQPTDPDVEEEDEVFEKTTTKPSSTSDSEVPAAIDPGTYGDPHFVTFAGSKYDFHAACDLILLENPKFRNGTGMTIHVRTKLQTWWSFVQAAAIRIGNDILEVEGGDHDYKFYVNGVEGVAESKLSFSQLGLKVDFKRVNAHQLQVRLDLADGDAIGLQTYKQFVRVDVKAKNAANYIGSSGLMGSYPTGAWTARDNSTMIHDANAFGLEWQVKVDDAMLFHHSPPDHPTTCQFPSTKESSLRRLQESDVSREAAERVCEHAANFLDCVSDVLATQDMDMAGAY